MPLNTPWACETAGIARNASAAAIKAKRRWAVVNMVEVAVFIFTNLLRSRNFGARDNEFAV